MAQILMDGSNILFWHANLAQPDVVVRVAQALTARRFVPVVYFDHSIARYMEIAAHLDVAQTVVAPQGTPADALLLEACQNGRIQIVSNDRFADWQQDHPRLRADWRVTGRIGKGGKVSFSKKLKPAPP